MKLNFQSHSDFAAFIIITIHFLILSIYIGYLIRLHGGGYITPTVILSIAMKARLMVDVLNSSIDR